MTTMTAATLAESEQVLIDARLDTIDRMLLGRIARSDRLAIVHEVESQIHELLADREAITRDDVLDVLRRLDPPEAYLPDAGTDREPRRALPTANQSAAPSKAVKKSSCGEGQIGGVVGLFSLGLFFLLSSLFYFLAQLVGSELILLMCVCCAAFVGIAGSIVGVVLSIRGRHQGILPIIGILAGLAALPMWVVGSMIVVHFVIGS